MILSARVISCAFAVGVAGSAAHADRLPWQAADTGTIALGSTEADIAFERVAVTVEHGRFAHVALTLATTRTRAVDVALPIDLPPHAAVREMTVTQRGHRAIAVPTAMWQASETYHSIVDAGRDPALVEADGRDRVQLHVFPLVRDSPAIVELAIELPPLATLVIDPSGHAIGELALTSDVEARRDRRVAEPRALALGEPRDDASPGEDVRSAVDGVTSLYAGPVPRPTAPSVLVDTVDRARPSRSIRVSALQRCYVAAAQRDPTLSGTFRVRLAIAVDGRLERATAEGLENDPAAQACARDEIASWQFHAGDAVLAITYVVDLRPVELARSFHAGLSGD